MTVVEQSVEIISHTPKPLELIELVARNCYQSKSRGDTEKFVRARIREGHVGVLEHACATVRFIVDRGTSHQIVRHRIASYCQESTRYCRYKDGVTVVRPDWIETPEDYNFWTASVKKAESDYLEALSKGFKPEEARSVLPHSTKTELIMTANLRAWRHFFKVRTTKEAQPSTRKIATVLLRKMQTLIPVVFEDITTFER